MNKKRIKAWAIDLKENIYQGVLKTAEKIESVDKKNIQDSSLFYFLVLIVFKYMYKNQLLDESIRKLETIENKGYKEGFMKVYEAYHKMLPDIFKEISPNIQRLYPYQFRKTIKEYVFRGKMIDDKDWKEVQIIGWLYQYYIHEAKEHRMTLHQSRISKEDIPYATQWFTPSWIVKYMVENTLGHMMIQKDGKEEWIQSLKFLIKENNIQNEESNIDFRKVEILDPACGAGHILVYVFDVLYEVYRCRGMKNIAYHILKYNIYGLDIDEYAIRMSRFSVMMKALQRDPNILTKIQLDKDLHIYCIHDSQEHIKMWNELLKINRLAPSLKKLKACFDHGKEYGSLMHFEDIDRKELQRSIQDVTNPLYKNRLNQYIHQMNIMDKQYDGVITNPPYLSSKKMSKSLKKYIEDHYKDYGYDLFSVFIKRNTEYAKKNGYLGFMTPFVWMFIKRYEKLRNYIVTQKHIQSLIQLEYSAFKEATVPICTFVLRNRPYPTKGIFVNLSDLKTNHYHRLEEREIIKNLSGPHVYKRSMHHFKKIKGMPITYWVKSTVIERFLKGVPLKTIADPRVGLQTSDNKRFVRYWFEVDPKKIGFGCSNRHEAKMSKKKWFPYQKGGSFRKWYGNHLFVVNWENDGEAIRKFNRWLNTTRSSKIGIANTKYYFQEGITWSFVSSSNFGVRICEKGFLFDTAGSCIFPRSKDLYFLLGLLSSKVSFFYWKMINPTLNFQPGNVATLPVIVPEDLKDLQTINDLSKECIKICKKDWNEKEISWEYDIHPFMKYKMDTLEDRYIQYTKEKEWEIKNLKNKEEALNHKFIKIYRLEEQLTKDISDKDISLKILDRRHMAQSFLSYIIGCIIGRFFVPVKDISFKVSCCGVLPIFKKGQLYDGFIDNMEIFFKKVLKKEYVKENIKWLSSGLGEGENPMNILKKYMSKQFYKDHAKTYCKRPIYWLLQSGKYKTFEALLDIHQYNANTLSIIRKQYVKPIIKALEDERYVQKLHVDKKLLKRIEEMNQYDKALEKLGNQVMDLDEGIQRNYEKFKSILGKC